MNQNREQSESVRLQTLEEYSVIAKDDDPAFDRLVRLAAQIFDAPLACISLVEETRVCFKWRLGLNLAETVRSETNLCSHVIRSDDVLVVNDLAADPLFCRNPFVVGYPYLRFYAGAPLISPNGARIGSFSLMDVKPLETVSHRDRAILKSLAEAVVAQLEVRRQADKLQRLASEYKLLASAVDQADEAILITDAQLTPTGPKIVYSNAAFADMTGYGRDELIGKSPSMFAGEKTEQKVIQQLQEDLRCDRIFEGETVKYKKDGSEFYLHWKVSPVHDAGGRLTNYVSTQRDVTRERAVQKELAATSDRLKSVLDSTTDAVLLLDSSWTITYVNDRARQLLPKPGPVIAANLWERFPETVGGTFWKKYHECAAKREPLCFEEFYEPLALWYGVNVFPTAEGIAIFFRDITDQKRTITELQERRRQIEDVGGSLPGAIYQITRSSAGHLSVGYVSAGITALSGAKPETIMTNDAALWGDIVLEDQAAFDAELTRTFTESTPFDYTYRVRIPGGTKWVAAKAKPYRLPSGDVVWNGLLLDVTDRKLFEEAIASARDRAEAASEAKSAFLAAMSHEIRTPLNGIIGTTSLLTDTPLTRQQKEFTETIRRSGEVLLAVVNDVLDFSKIESGKLQVERREFSLHDLLHHVIDIVGDSADRKGLGLTLIIQESVPDEVVGDAQRITQVLLNLLSNAIKFTAEGSVSLEASLNGGTQADVSVRFSVRDTGIGITPEHQPKLFQRFSQADSSSARRYDGTGLGLAISKGLLDLMGGHIHLSTQVNVGTTFDVDVPLHREESPRRHKSPALISKRLVVIADAPLASPVFSATDPIPLDLFLLKTALDYPQNRQAWSDHYLLSAAETHDPVVKRVTDVFRAIPNPRERLIVLLDRRVNRTIHELKDLGVEKILIAPLRVRDLVRYLDVRSSESIEKTARAGATRKARILVAEDNPINRRVAQNMIERLGYETSVAENGRQAVELATTTSFDVILMDCGMPEMDGLQATRLIRQHETGGPRVPIVALTANAISGYRERCLEAGMDDYLTKPVHIKSLGDTLTKWLANAVLSQDLALEPVS